MCTVYDPTWDLAIRWGSLAVIALSLAWVAYRSGGFAALSRRTRRAVAAFADDGALQTA